MSKLKLNKVIKSSDGITKKYLFNSGEDIISAVFIDTDDKYIICIPTSIGCNMQCNICYTGNNIPLKRRLNYYNEMSYIIDFITITEDIRFGSKPILVSVMGTGEPLYNLSNLLFTINMYKSSDIKFAISTTVPSLDLLEDLFIFLKLTNIRVKLQISLHSGYDESRREILSHKLPDIETVIDKLIELNKDINLDIEYNYCLLEGINDSMIHADKLADLLPEKSIIKLNKFNTFPNCKFEPSDARIVDLFKDRLLYNGLVPEIYETDGVDINGACGQTDIITEE